MNTVTWQWTDKDWEAWYEMSLQEPTYRDRYRNFQVSCAAASAFLGLIVSLRLVSTWLEVLGAMCGFAALAFVLASAYLSGNARFQRRRWPKEQAKSPEAQHTYTLRLEDEGVRFVRKNAEHWYRWCVVETETNPSHGFLLLSIEGKQAIVVPPSAFPDPIQRTLLLETLQRLCGTENATTTLGSWWHQKQVL